MATTVVTLRGRVHEHGGPAPPGVVYIGGPLHRGGGRLPGSVWANPYRAARYGTHAKRRAKYRTYLLEERPDLVARLPALRGKVLGCWCAPEACHGDVLAELADDGE